MKLGYACIPLTLKHKPVKKFIFKNFSEELFYSTLDYNLDSLKKTLKYNVDNNIKLFRISSDIVPFGGIVTLPWDIEKATSLKEIGDFIKKHQLRVSMHPGQYTVINSKTETVVKNSLSELEYHCKFLDSLGLDYTHKIVLHVGGVFNDKSSALKRFIFNFNKLSSSCKMRLVIENDEKNYNIEEVLHLCNHLKIPAVFDVLHHSYNGCKLSLKDILLETSKTWKPLDGLPKLHYSNQDLSKRLGAHSKFIYTKDFLEFYNLASTFDLDIIFEVKDKNLSCIKILLLLKLLSEDSKDSSFDTFLHKYKYSLMERNLELYKDFFQRDFKTKSYISLFEKLDEILLMKINKNDFLFTFNLIYKDIEPLCNTREKNLLKKYIKAIEDMDILSEDFESLFNGYVFTIKNNLKKLSEKYNISSLENSYYVYY